MARWRWGVIAAGSALALLASGLVARRFAFIGASALWLIVVHVFAGRAARWPFILRLAPFLYFFCDYWLAAFWSILQVDPLVVAAFLALSMEYALLLDPGARPWVPLLMMALATALLRSSLLPLAYGLGAGFLVLTTATVAFATSVLCVYAEREQSRLNQP